MANEAMMRQYRDLKSKHPDAMLLFRCGDFYETYEDDARECAKVLGITLTKRQSDGVAMAGFPHHRLDTYLPKLIRTGHRVAICDQLDPPPGPRLKRGETIDKAAIKREQSDVCIDSAEREQAQTKFNNSSTNQNNSEDEVMANENVKVTDLIGKSISNGGNAKYTINAIEGDKVSVTFQMGDSEGKPMTMGVAQVEKLLAGGWQVSDGTQEAPKTEEPKAKTVKMTSEREQSGTRSGSAERESSRPQGKMEPEPKPKQEQPAKPKVTLKRKQPQTEEPKQEQPQGGRYRFSTYTRPTSDGGTKTLGRIDGLQEGDELLERGVSEKIHASPMYDRDGERKVWWLSFGKRYVEAGRKVCQALNEGRSLDDCQAIVDAQTEENHAQSEARRKQNAERKQKRDAKKQTSATQPSDVSHQPSSGKTYTEAEVADLMRRVIAGDQEAMAIVNAMAA